jgi:hypothetical protein
MHIFKHLSFVTLALLCTTASYALGCLSLPSSPCPWNCRVNTCCEKMGGISYCDSSAGRYVCNNGFISSCYCTRHAVMDLQHLEGCCLWQGGVMSTTVDGVVLCNDGTASVVCTTLKGDERAATY